MEKIKALIVEDNMLTAKDIAGCLENEGFEIIAMVDNGEDAIRLASEHRPDIAILDIGLGEGKMDGIETARRINQFVKLPVIFLTAYSDLGTIDRAATTMPASYLVKPVNDSQLLASIHVAMTRYATTAVETETEKQGSGPDYFFNNKSLFVKADKFVKLNTEKILCVEASGNYVSIITPDHKYAILSSFSAFYDQLRKINPDFIRIHRSYIINLRQLDSFDHIHAIIGKREIPIGKSFREDFFRQVGYRK
jgi:DNA-binding LytR/AlgR family response regulator